MVENAPYERKSMNDTGRKSAMDKSAYMNEKHVPWHKPMDSVGPVAASRAPTMSHALDMIQQLAQPQYEGHGNLDTGMPEGENLMRRAVNFMNKNPR